MGSVLNGNFQPAGEGQPRDGSQQGQPEQQPSGDQPAGNNQKYLTEAEALQLFDRLFSQKAQSISDKTANRVQRVIAEAQQQGVRLSAQQAQALLNVTDKVNGEQQQHQAQPVQRQAAAQPQGDESGQPETQPHPIILIAQGMMDRAGVQIEDDDPELEGIYQGDDEAEFLASIKRAIENKRNRLAKALPARMPSMTGGNSGGGGKEALTGELERLLKQPRKDWEKIREVKAQLAQYNR